MQQYISLQDGAYGNSFLSSFNDFQAMLRYLHLHIIVDWIKGEFSIVSDTLLKQHWVLDLQIFSYLLTTNLLVKYVTLAWFVHNKHFSKESICFFHLVCLTCGVLRNV